MITTFAEMTIATFWIETEDNLTQSASFRPLSDCDSDYSNEWLLSYTPLDCPPPVITDRRTILQKASVMSIKESIQSGHDWEKVLQLFLRSSLSKVGGAALEKCLGEKTKTAEW